MVFSAAVLLLIPGWQEVQLMGAALLATVPLAAWPLPWQ